MTREEAIEILKTDGCYECAVEKDSPYNCSNGGCEIREAYYMAIEALERKKGEWMYLYEDNYKCSICGSWWCCTDSQIDEMYYCPNCGSDMRGEDDE